MAELDHDYNGLAELVDRLALPVSDWLAPGERELVRGVDFHHTTTKLDSAEAMPDGHEQIVQVTVPLRGVILADHPHKLPRYQHYLPRCHTIEGRSPEDRP